MLARHWPREGARHDVALTIGGFLARAGLDENEAALMLRAIAKAAGDKEVNDRAQAGRDAVKQYAEGKAPHWRLTELGYMTEAPTRDFAAWKDNPFHDQKTNSRAGKAARRVPKKAHTSVLEKAHGNDAKCAGKGAHAAATGVLEKAHILSHTTTYSSTCLPSSLV